MENGLVNLESEALDNFARFLRESDQHSDGDWDASALALDRELRSTNLRMVHRLLENPLQQLISGALVTERDVDEKARERGRMFLYDARRPDYRDDGMAWDESNGMCVKMIVYNAQKREYRLKNNKNTTGHAVMRRQTFRGAAGTASSGWRKHEYKLVLREKLFRPDSDGSLSVIEAQRLQALPVLVHYFFKKPPSRKRKQACVVGGAEETQRKRFKSSDDEEDCVRQPMGFSDFARPDFYSSVSPSSVLSTSFSAGDGHAPRFPSYHQRHQLDPSRNGTSLASALSLASQHESHPEERYPCQPAHSHSHSLAGSGAAAFFGGSDGPFAVKMEEVVEAEAEGRQFLFDPSEEDSSSAEESKPECGFMHVSSLPMSANLGASLDLDRLLAVDDYVDFPKSPQPLSSASFAPPIEAHATIQTYAPDTGPWCSRSKMLVIVDGFPQHDDVELHAVFGSRLGEMKRVSPNAYEVSVPPSKSSGPVSFWCACVADGCSLYTNALPFYYTPTNRGELKIDFASIGATTNAARREVLSKFKHTARVLDLSGNYLTDVSFISEMDHLETLVLDNNLLMGDIALPFLPSLKTLSLNANRISVLEHFSLASLRTSLPSLQYLSLLNNDANPYFSQRPHHYYNFRIYVISCLPSLTHLDATAVTIEELRHATSIMNEEKEMPPFISSHSPAPIPPKVGSPSSASAPAPIAASLIQSLEMFTSGHPQQSHPPHFASSTPDSSPSSAASPVAASGAKKVAPLLQVEDMSQQRLFL